MAAAASAAETARQAEALAAATTASAEASAAEVARQQLAEAWSGQDGLREEVLRQAAQLLGAEQLLQAAQQAYEEVEQALAASEERGAELKQREESGAAL